MKDELATTDVVIKIACGCNTFSGPWRWIDPAVFLGMAVIKASGSVMGKIHPDQIEKPWLSAFNLSLTDGSALG